MRRPARRRLARRRRLRLGIVANEFFHTDLGGHGGFGFAAREVAGLFASDRSLGVDAVFVSAARRRAVRETELRVHGVRLLHPDPNPDAWSRRLAREGFDLLLTIDFRSNYGSVLDALPGTPAIVWIRDPRRPDDVARYMALRLPDRDEPPASVAPVDVARLPELVAARPGRLLQIATIDPSRAEMIPSAYGVGADQVHLLPNVVAIDPSSPKSARPRVLALGRLDPIKRPWLVAELAERFPEVEFVLAGRAHFSGEGAWEPRDLPPNVRLAGHLDGDEKRAAISSAWVLANTSIHESVPMSFLESLACETPLLAMLPAAGLTERFGILVDNAPGDGRVALPALAGALRRLLDDAALRERLGRDGRAWVREHHSRERFLESFAELARRAGTRVPFGAA